MSHLDVSFKWSIVKTLNKCCNCFLAYKMLTKITYLFCQNWWKWPKRLCQYFPGDHRYDCNCFRRFLYTPWTTSHPNIMAVNRILQNPPGFYSTVAFFGIFREVWNKMPQKIKFLVNTWSLLFQKGTHSSKRFWFFSLLFFYSLQFKRYDHVVGT